MKVKKRKKSRRMRGSHTHGRGFKKKARGSGHRGGVGMAGTGKRADQKKTLVLNFPEKYFGKDKALRRKPSPKLEVINLGDIEKNLQAFTKKGIAKEINKDEYELNLKNYKILGDGNINVKLRIHAQAASSSAIDKVKKAGGEIVLNSKPKD